MGGHDVKLPPVPDWRIYRVEDSPELMKVRADLASRGLCYPWLRNEVWRYTKHPIESSGRQSFKYILFGGFKYGVAAGIVTIIIDKAYMAYVENKYGGAHDHHH